MQPVTDGTMAPTGRRWPRRDGSRALSLRVRLIGGLLILLFLALFSLAVVVFVWQALESRQRVPLRGPGRRDRPGPRASRTGGQLPPPGARPPPGRGHGGGSRANRVGSRAGPAAGLGHGRDRAPVAGREPDGGPADPQPAGACRERPFAWTRPTGSCRPRAAAWPGPTRWPPSGASRQESRTRSAIRSERSWATWSWAAAAGKERPSG